LAQVKEIILLGGKKVKKSLSLVCTLLVSVFILASCGNGGSSNTQAPSANGDGDAPNASAGQENPSNQDASKDGLVIKVIPMSTASAYWTALRTGAEDAAKEFGDEWGGIKIQFDGPESDSDMAKQIDLINNSVSAGADGLLVAVCSPTVPHDAIVDAVEAGTYVICVDQYLDPMDASAFYGTNGVQMCKDLAAYMTENVLDGTGSYGELVYNMTSMASVDRHDGFVEGMTESAPEMKNIGYEITNSDIAETQTLVSNMMQANKDIKCLFANNDRSALGALNALKQEGIQGEIALCNVDCSLETLQAMRTGTIQASALQMPYNQGYEGVKMLLALMSGEEVDKEGDSGSFILTAENMDSEEALAAIRQYIQDYKPEDSYAQG